MTMTEKTGDLERCEFLQWEIRDLIEKVVEVEVADALFCEIEGVEVGEPFEEAIEERKRCIFDSELK